MHHYNHQDWETVVLNKKSKSNNVKKINSSANKEINNDDEPEKQNFISLSNSRLIQQGRNDEGFSQKQLANKLSVEQKLIQLYECGKVVPDIKIMIKLEKILKITLDKSKKQ